MHISCHGLLMSTCKAAKAAVTSPIKNIRSPVSDITVLKNYTKTKWQEQWNHKYVNNKLKLIKTLVGFCDLPIQNDR